MCQHHKLHEVWATRIVMCPKHHNTTISSHSYKAKPCSCPSFYLELSLRQFRKVWIWLWTTTYGYPRLRRRQNTRSHSGALSYEPSRSGWYKNKRTNQSYPFNNPRAGNEVELKTSTPYKILPSLHNLKVVKPRQQTRSYSQTVSKVWNDVNIDSPIKVPCSVRALASVLM